MNPTEVPEKQTETRIEDNASPPKPPQKQNTPPEKPKADTPPRSENAGQISRQEKKSHQRTGALRHGAGERIRLGETKSAQRKNRLESTASENPNAIMRQPLK